MIDGQWFRRKLTQHQRSQRELARRLEVDASAITHLFNGFRRMQIAEAEKIAAFLGEPLEDVLRAAGLPLRNVERTRQCRIVGTINGEGVLRKKDLGMIDLPQDMPPNTVAARIRAEDGPLVRYDGGILFFA